MIYYYNNRIKKIRRRTFESALFEYSEKCFSNECIEKKIEYQEIFKQFYSFCDLLLNTKDYRF